jgi:uncharacterized peroxidase-related enzyme
LRKKEAGIIKSLQSANGVPKPYEILDKYRAEHYWLEAYATGKGNSSHHRLEAYATGKGNFSQHRLEAYATGKPTKETIMSRIQSVNPANATGKAKDLLDAVQSKLGLVPNMTKAMASSPSVLDGYLALSGSLSKGSLSAKTREQIALTVAETNECGYCLAAHSAIGKMVGLSDEQILDSRRGTAVDAKSEAIIRFARQVVEAQGHVSDEDLTKVRAAGIDDGGIAEIVANVALNIFTNYFNHVAETEIDFPKVETLGNTSGECAPGSACHATH